MCLKSIRDVLRVVLNEPVHSLMFRCGLLSVKNVTIFQFNYVTRLSAIAALEHHEIWLRSGKIQCFALLDVPLASQKYAIRHDFLLEKRI